MTSWATPADVAADRVVFTPPPAHVEASQLTDFVRYCESHTELTFVDHGELHDFSVREFRLFWRLFLRWSGVLVSGSDERVCEGDAVEHAEFFPDLRLSYVENLLRPLPDREDAPALIAHHAGRGTVSLSRRQLRHQVRAVAAALRGRGLRPGDRVVAVSGNTEQLVVAALGVFAVGATLSTVAPDLGSTATLSRFGQLRPTLLLYGVGDAVVLDDRARQERLDHLVSALPDLTATVLLDGLELDPPGSVPCWALADLVREGTEVDDGEGWPRFGFSHPLSVLFSSGTTGTPKAIVHTAGGTLLEHVKEHRLHEDLGPGDVLFFTTTPAWMMWNWQLSALAVGSTLVLNDAPVADADALWSIVADDEVTVFGTGPTYLKFSQSAGLRPREQHDLGALRLVLSTGSVLGEPQFDWVRDHVGDLPLHSISGGTDIVGCFVLGSPHRPVRRGDISCRSLGLDVRSLRPDPDTGVGELVCASPFPSRPLGLLGDPDGTRFHDAYFAQNAGLWTHGDLVSIDDAGYIRMHGRSDGVMNIAGVRIGPSEIYGVLDRVPELAACMAVEQSTPGEVVSSRLVLLVVPADGHRLDAGLAGRIRQRIAHETSPAHVPALVVEVPDLPRTFSGKDSERAARDTVNGSPPATAGSLRNPEVLESIRQAVATAGRRAGSGRRPPSTPGGLAALVDAFAAELGVEAGPDDDFFELGGSSLQVASLRQRVLDATGVEVPTSDMFMHPTPRLLQALVERGGVESWKPVMLLRPGTGGRPIFLLFDLTGDVAAYRGLVALLPIERPVYGVRARGLDVRPDPDRPVESMALATLDAMRTVQAGGPYTVIGYSFGGLVAWEVARRLSREGDEVGEVILLDSYLSVRALDLRGRLRYEVWGRPRLYLSWLLHGGAGRVNALGRRLSHRLVPGLRVGQPPRPRTARDREFLEGNLTAMKGYRPQPRSGIPVVFVRCGVRFANKPDPVPMWRGVVDDDLFAVRHVPGEHWDLMTGRQAEMLAAELAPLLASRPR